MSAYRFGRNSLIDEVNFQHTEGGGTRVYLHARDGASPSALNAVKKTLIDHAMQWTPILEGGKPCLEVRGIGKDEEKFLKLLSEEGAVAGDYRKSLTIGDEVSFKTKLMKNTLRASGISYFAGDISYLSYANSEARNMQGKLVKPVSLAAGIFYALGTPFITIFGRGDKSNLQLKHLSFNMLHELEGKGIDVPQNAAVRAEANGHNSNIVKKILTFSSRYPAEIANSFFAAAGSMILLEKAADLKTFKWRPVDILKKEGLTGLKASLDHKIRIPGQSPHHLKSVLTDIGLGGLSVLAGLTSVFVGEEVPKPDEPKKKGLARAWQWVKEKPLRTAGLLLFGATSFHAASTWKDWNHVESISVKEVLKNEGKEAAWDHNRLRKFLPRRAIFVGANLAAEVLMMMSSKGHGAGVISDSSLDRSSYAVAADLIERSAPEKREALLETLTRYLAGKEHLGGEAEVHRQGIREQLAAMDANPWTGLAHAERMSAALTPPNEHWQKKIAAAQLMAPEIAPAL